MKYNVLGFSKCGTTALTAYLNSQGHEARQNEFLIYKKDEGIKIHNEKYPDYTPVVIIRDEVEKLWSEFHYRPNFRNMTFDEFLDFRDELWMGVGLHNPLEGVNYQYYISYWEMRTGKKLTVLKLDDMKNIMPKMNQSNCPEIPEKYIEKVRSLL